MTIVIGVLVLLAALIVFIASRPTHFRIERSAQVVAPTQAIFELLNDFHQWHRWSPWEKLDPAMKKTFGGAPAGPGAHYAWRGNSKAGQGSMTLLHSTPNEVVSVQIQFVKPFSATNLTTFKLSPTAGDRTTVHWIMEGKNGFAAKAFGMLVNVDRMLGKDFEEGLVNLGNAARAAR